MCEKCLLIHIMDFKLPLGLIQHYNLVSKGPLVSVSPVSRISFKYLTNMEANIHLFGQRGQVSPSEFEIKYISRFPIRIQCFSQNDLFLK